MHQEKEEMFQSAEEKAGGRGGAGDIDQDSEHSHGVVVNMRRDGGGSSDEEGSESGEETRQLTGEEYKCATPPACSEAESTSVSPTGLHNNCVGTPPRTPSLSSNQDICRICHCEAEVEKPLIQPCFCTGTLRYVHQSCIQQWIKSSGTKCCELCRFNFITATKFKQFKSWEKLDMSPVERRKILCSVMFHIVAVTCVVWSLYVLIDRTTEEIKSGVFEWPFWTKLIVVAIGFTGGLVFMYVQCKMYLQLCRRWRAYNRVIYVQNCPDEILQNQPRPDKQMAADEDAKTIAARSSPVLVELNTMIV